ncbi:zinc-dependent metalloprotease [Lignipirellula cremea]|uniref:DUF5117 domain-containing protein n=1 Tax=Lignipirellula cremea TaxID=2528010 RepID=A0A518DXR5_9BACT|nr:zinc-dependent metalloprotease [Lignipirellula cremea]QDU96639.1 hypothetical protein Pla8534_44600 [Lignipirellula cremea]
MFAGTLLRRCVFLALLFATAFVGRQAQAALPAHADVLKDFEEVVSTVDGKKSLFTIWVRKKDNQMLAELPKTFASQKYFIALTLAGGDQYAGLQSGDVYVYWRKYDDRLALIAPDLDTRSSGDNESKASVDRLFTGQVLLDLPIISIGPGGGPIIDMDYLLVQKSTVFFGSSAFNKALPQIYSIAEAKAFPGNVELAFEMPDTSGKLRTLHYSISLITEDPTFKPRLADERVGYFITSFSDLGKYADHETRVRFINRWNLQKADPKLRLSPPKEPLVFYIEHTTPIRYRRWVREGVLSWNRAFEKVGISDAIEVHYQDAASGAHMDKDPEDVRFNFVRWLNNDQGTAIGPSRVNPKTGQILDADIILTDGWIRHYRFQFEDLMPQLAMEGYGPDTLAWLADHPDWDPRLRMASPSQVEHLRSGIRMKSAQPYAGHPFAQADSKLMGSHDFDGLVGRTSQTNGMCLAAQGKAFDMALMHMTMTLAMDKEEAEKEDAKDEKEKDKEDPKSMIDGMPEEFIGPLLAHLVAHEVGHTLGLRHNFKASSIYSVEEINSDAVKGKKPLAGSVMDYTPVNIRYKSGAEQGDYAMTGIGPYDEWAIEYGYTSETDLKPILDRVADPNLVYATDEDAYGPDPLARRYDFGSDPLAYAKEQVDLAEHHRGRLLKGFVKDGESWSRVRRGYGLTLALQVRALSMMANWVGGVHVYRDKKGDTNGRAPLEVVDYAKQRAALEFVMKNSFHDEAFGLTPELLRWMTNDKWLDEFSNAIKDSTYPVHDSIMGVQSSTLTMILKPTTLQRVYDNEFRTPADEDALTLPELLDRVSKEIWSELDQKLDHKYTARAPMTSSLRRNLQREHLKRLIDLAMPGAGSQAAYKPISTLSVAELRRLGARIQKSLKDSGDKLDPYTRAHLEEAASVVSKALDAQYIYNANDLRSSGGFHSVFGRSDG